MKKWGPYLVFLAAMLWATDAPFRYYLTGNLSSNFIVLGEHFFDILVAVPILLLNWSDMRKLNAKEWLAVGVIAVGGSALASVAFTEAFKFVNPSVALLLQKLQPLIAISLATSLLKERLNRNFWLWCVVALFGAYLVSFSGLVPRLYVGEKFNPNTVGVALALVAAILWGASTVLGKYVLNKASFKTMTSLRFILAFVFLILFNFWQHSYPQFSTLSAKDYLFIFIIAMASGVISLFIYYRGLQDTKASVATLAELGYPAAAVVVNYFFIPGSALSAAQILGMLILLLSLYGLSRSNSDSQVNNSEITEQLPA